MLDSDQLISVLSQAAIATGSVRDEAQRALFTLSAPKIYGICLGVLRDEARAATCLSDIFTTLFQDIDDLAQASEPVTAVFTVVCEQLASHALGHVEAPLYGYVWDDVATDPQALTYCLFEAGFVYGQSYEEIAATLKCDPNALQSMMRQAISACYEADGAPLEIEFIEAAEFSSGLMNIDKVDDFIDAMGRSAVIQDHVRLWSADFVTLLEPFERHTVPDALKDDILAPLSGQAARVETSDPQLNDIDEGADAEAELPYDDLPKSAPLSRSISDDQLTPPKKRRGVVIFLIIGVALILSSLAMLVFAPQLQRWAERLFGAPVEEQIVDDGRYFYFAAKSGDVQWRGSLSADGTALQLTPVSPPVAVVAPLDRWMSFGQNAPVRLVETITAGQIVRLPPELGAQFPFAILVLAPPFAGAESQPDVSQALYAALVDDALYASD